MLNVIRWRLFVALSYVGWWICPEPHRRNLNVIWRAQMNDYNQAIDRAKREGLIEPKT
jgi:hypothetical protein